MTPPKATPDRKGKACKPIVYSTDMPRLGQNILVGRTLERFKRELLEVIEEYKLLSDESKTTQED